MAVLKYSLVILSLMFVFYINGLLVKALLKRKNDDILNIILNGFVTTFAVFELIALPFHLFKWNITVLYYTELTVFILLILISIAINCLRIKYDKTIKKIDLKQLFLKIIKKNIVLNIAIVLMIVLQMFLSSYLYVNNEDDSFYISWSQEAKELDNYLDSDPSMGNEDSFFTKTYILNSWEVFNGFVARVFNIEVSTLAHTICPIMLIMISYMAYYLLLRKIDNKNAKLMLIVLAYIFLFSGVSPRFRGYTLLMRIWQGKTIITNIFIPYVLYQMIDMRLNWKKIVLLLITNISSIAFNPIAIWIFPFIYLYFAITMLLKKQIVKAIKMIIVVLPYVLLFLIYYFIAVKAKTGAVGTGNVVGYIDTFKNYIKDGQVFFIVYLISLVFVMIRSNKKAKVLFVLIPILTFLTLLNPVLCKLVQKYVTASATYWRVYWLLPMELTISYAIVQVIRLNRNKYIKIITLVSAFVVIAGIGKNMYASTKEFSKHINSQKIPQYIIDETKYIIDNSNDKVVVIAPEEPLHGATMRQLTSKVALLYSREIYERKTSKENINTYKKIYKDLDKEQIEESFNNKEIDFIILENDKKEIVEKLDIRDSEIVYKDEYYFIIANCNSDKVKTNLKEVEN